MEKYLTIRENPEIRETLINQAYKEVCDQYSWDIVTDKLIQFYYTFPNGCSKYKEGNDLYYTYTAHGQGKIIGYFIVNEI